MVGLNITGKILILNNEVRQNFFHRGEALSHEKHGVLLKSLHSAFDGEIAKLVGLGAGCYGTLEFVVHRQKFVNAHTALVAVATALVASVTFEKRRRIVARLAEIAQCGVIHFDLPLAILTNSPGKALGDDADCRIRHEKGLDPHFLQTGE